MKVRHPSPLRRSPALKHHNATSQGASTATAALGQDKDDDLVYVADEVRSLFSELKFYEELSGRRSILDTREVVIISRRRYHSSLLTLYAIAPTCPIAGAGADAEG